MSRKLLWFMPLALAVPAAAAAAYAPMPMSAPKMGPSMRISRPAFKGYYDGHKDTYLNTDVSNKADATAMHINYSRVVKTVPLASAPEIYLVQGKAAAGSGPGSRYRNRAQPASRASRSARVPPHRARRARVRSGAGLYGGKQSRG
jgi:hypothetical protein